MVKMCLSLSAPVIDFIHLRLTVVLSAPRGEIQDKVSLRGR